VSIVSCRCTYCCLETSHGKITRHNPRYCTVAFSCVRKCELSYMCTGHDFKLSEIISNMVYGFWFGIGEGDIVIICKQVIRLDSRLLRLCNWSALLLTVLHFYCVT